MPRCSPTPIAKVFYASVFIEGLSIYGIMPFVAGRLEAPGLGGLTEAGLVIGAIELWRHPVYVLTVGRLLAAVSDATPCLSAAAAQVCALALVPPPT